MEEKNVFEELDELNEVIYLENYCNGHNDAADGKPLNENNHLQGYLDGYNSEKNRQQSEYFAAWCKAHEAEVKDAIKRGIALSKVK